MAIMDSFIAELEFEANSTVKSLERVPNDKLDWRPHPKSFSMGRLASHIAEGMSWIVPTLNLPELNFEEGKWEPFNGNSAEEIVQHYKNGLAQALAAMRGYPDEKLMENWTLKSNTQTFFTMPRLLVMRNFVLNHQIHHRAQLGLYLRLNDVPVPSVYGPSADEQ